MDLLRIFVLVHASFAQSAAIHEFARAHLAMRQRHCSFTQTVDIAYLYLTRHLLLRRFYGLKLLAQVSHKVRTSPFVSLTPSLAQI